MDVTIQIIAAFVGSLGYGIIFNVRRGHLISAAFGGMLTWAVYLISAAVTGGIIAPSVIGGAFAAMYAEILARIRKAPANQFLVVSLMPLVPGRALYYTMSCAVQRDWLESRYYGTQTLQYALGIAAGMCLVWAFWDMARKIAEKKRQLQTEKGC
ncbi:MAG TPA: threonine/serine exporter family protein [Candidatus Lachnoclostridium stercoravium]|uniref:Threonine/serine exporter family protein n=1 Tax=Candidatus Lachnoclostridium stercoravium TaxID=2838633 RepID=A0A9D2HJC8_9FIRM|nr:threonine/serine exporter family protein [Candidatus Lachnoclostridium stercoravium]